MKPLEQWICDTCGTVVEKENAYVIWRTDENRRAVDFRIIHQRQCDDTDKFHQSMPLDTFLGTDGLTELLSFLSLGPLKGQPACDGIGDMNCFVDFIRRVQIPYYEEARQHFDTEEVRERFSDANEVYPYLTKSLQSIIEESGSLQR